jgi:Protein of unknown function (DUF3141)
MATVLQFDHDVLMSGRSLRKPINFALSRIVSVIDLRKRPVVVVDPRAGQGPGIIGAGNRTTFAECEWIAGLEKLLAAPLA